ncbi:hypothetical protein AKO1_011525, partial [Acrasis kona]
MIEQVASIITKLCDYFKNNLVGARVDKEQDAAFQNLNDFLCSVGLEHINLFDVCEFIDMSELTKKLSGFAERAKQQEDKNNGSVKIHSETENSTSLGIHSFASFLLALMNFSKDGKILVDHKIGVVKFVLLNPGVYFKEIVEEARSVVLAGGTMQPVAPVVQMLFPDIKDRLTVFECGHVIPDDNLLPICLSKGPSGHEFDFTFQSRSNAKTLDSLGNFLVNLCNVVPDGIVVFYPSYAYEEQVFKHFEANDFVRRIERKKKFYRELKSSGAGVDNVLREYKKTIDNNFPAPDRDMYYKGSMLSCVVGGKMSEGINFSDGYARCVVVVGLPFPNPNDPELKERMSYLKTNGNDYLENLCMKAVNQSIGRSIRHANDYSSIFLLDKRYVKSTQIKSKLPKWIRSRLITCEEFGGAFSKCAQFFTKKK